MIRFQCILKLLYQTILGVLILVGCSKDLPNEYKLTISNSNDFPDTSKNDEMETFDHSKTNAKTDGFYSTGKIPSPEPTPVSEPEIIITEIDWSNYFNGRIGTAVLYNASSMKYAVYHSDLAVIQRSPCSTFKIISSLIALENSILEPEHSVHTWSGEIFWNETWNQDMNFKEAFRTSCVWYFREIINEIGKEKIQEELDKLNYGNCDISDWEGRLNTNNNNRALTGFWVESSLKISPKEQVEVMARIFGPDSIYSEKTRKELKQVMLTEEQQETGISIYGKTGMGKAYGVVVDAWFTGFAENSERNETIYFCVYLGQTDDKNVSSAVAKDIAIQILSDFWAS